METVKAVKSISISYQPSEEILQLLRDFRSMVNYCLEVGLKKNVTGRFKLTRLVYGELSKFGYHSWYDSLSHRNSRNSNKNYRKAKRRDRMLSLQKLRGL